MPLLEKAIVAKQKGSEKSRDARKAEAIHRRHDPVAARNDVMRQPAKTGIVRRRPLRFDNLFHLGERGAGIEKLLSARSAPAAANLRIEFKYTARK